MLMALQDTKVVVSKTPTNQATKKQRSTETTKKPVIRTGSQSEYPVTTEVSYQIQLAQHWQRTSVSAYIRTIPSQYTKHVRLY